MAHFIGSVHGARGPETRLGTRKSGINVCANGLDSGVEAVGKNEPGGDTFAIYATGGSNSPGAKRMLGVVAVVDGRLVFRDK